MTVQPSEFLGTLPCGDIEGAARSYTARVRTRPALRGVLLERLGPVVWARTPQSASHVLEELEETARLWLMAGPVTPCLDATQITALCERFGVASMRTQPS